MENNQLKPEEAAAVARREYQREWRRANPDKVKAAQDRYWTRKGLEKRSQEQTAAADPESNASE